VDYFLQYLHYLSNNTVLDNQKYTSKITSAIARSHYYTITDWNATRILIRNMWPDCLTVKHHCLYATQQCTAVDRRKHRDTDTWQGVKFLRSWMSGFKNDFEGGNGIAAHKTFRLNQNSNFTIWLNISTLSITYRIRKKMTLALTRCVARVTHCSSTPPLYVENLCHLSYVTCYHCNLQINGQRHRQRLAEKTSNVLAIIV